MEQDNRDRAMLRALWGTKVALTALPWFSITEEMQEPKPGRAGIFWTEGTTWVKLRD